VLLPEDAHKPCIPIGGEISDVEKIVLKVELR
jgi:beta-galactosidase beta subunit